MAPSGARSAPCPYRPGAKPGHRPGCEPGGVAYHFLVVIGGAGIPGEAAVSTLDESTAGSQFRLELSGEIDMAREDELAELRNAFEASGRSTAIVDLSQVTFLDTTGLAFLVELQGIAHGRGGTVVLHDPSRTLIRLLEITALDQVFEVSQDGHGPPVAAG